MFQSAISRWESSLAVDRKIVILITTIGYTESSYMYNYHRLLVMKTWSCNKRGAIYRYGRQWTAPWSFTEINKQAQTRLGKFKILWYQVIHSLKKSINLSRKGKQGCLFLLQENSIVGTGKATFYYGVFSPDLLH